MRKSIKETDGIKVHERKISNLSYPDDTALISSTKENLQNMINRVASASNKHGLYLNSKKTKIMAIGRNKTETNIFLNNERLEQVESYLYLGASISEDGTCMPEIKTRLAIAKSNMLKLLNIWKDKSIQTTLKIRLIKALIWPIGIYGCESWTLNQQAEKKIEAFEQWTYRRMLQVSYREHRTNEWVLN